MSARAVVAFREPFLRRAEEYADAGVALDEIMSLRTSEPAVLRVSAEGGGAKERGAVDGDWLCDDGGREPKRIPRRRWRFYPTDRPAKATEIIDFWESYDASPYAMMSGVLMARVTPATSAGAIRAACACARKVVGLIASGGSAEAADVAEGSIAAIERMVMRGGLAQAAQRIDRAVASEHLRRLYDLQQRTGIRSSAWACAVNTCRSATGLLIAASYAVENASHALAEAAPGLDPSSSTPADHANATLAAEAALADAVRASLPLVEVLRAAAGSGDDT